MTLSIWYKSMIATISLILLSNFGVILMTLAHSYMKVLGTVDFIATFLILLFVVYHYMDSPFYRSLGTEAQG